MTEDALHADKGYMSRILYVTSAVAPVKAALGGDDAERRSKDTTAESGDRVNELE